MTFRGLPHAQPNPNPHALGPPLPATPTPPLTLGRPFWQVHAISVLEQLCLALSDEFEPHLPALLPRLLAILHTDRSSRRRPTLRVLHALAVFDQVRSPAARGHISRRERRFSRRERRAHAPLLR